MLLEVEADAFACDDHLVVYRLFGLGIDGRHRWRLGPAAALAAEDFAASNMPGMRATAEFVRKIAEESANPVPGGMARVVVTRQELRDTVADLERAAVVVVEDGISDECFVLALARAFGESRVVAAERLGWLRFSHAGGLGRMAVFAAREREQFKMVVRVAALLDSDRSAPRQRTPNHDKLERIKACGVSEVHMWQGREVENYVPTRVWDHHFPHKKVEVDRIRATIPAHRAYLDVKVLLRGRRGMPSPLIPEELILNESDFAELGADAVDELRTLLAMICRIL